MDTSSKKKFSTGTRKKLTKATASVTEKVNDLHSLEDTISHSLAS